MSPAIKNGILLVVIVGALAGAALVFRHSRKETVYPDDPKLATQWICTKCGKHVTLTPAQYKEWMDSKDKVRRDPNYPGRIIVFWCDQCNDFSVVRAAIDRKTMEWYPPTDPAGNTLPPPGEKTPAAKPAKAPGK